MVKEGIKIRRGKQLGYGSLNEGEGRIYDVQMLDIILCLTSGTGF